MMLTLTPATAPLDTLSLSPHNVRADTTYELEPLAALAETIAAVGLLHPLVVHPVKGGHAVLAGGRRLAALQMLAAAERLPTDHPVPVQLAQGTKEELAQASLTENYQREPMTDVQVYRSVRAMTSSKTGKKLTDEALADAVGVSLARMQRIRRLAHVHPDIMQAYEDKEIHQSVLHTLAKEADPNVQIKWFAKLKAGEIHNYALSTAMGFGNREHSQMLKAVTVEAYTARGGRLDADLFGNPEDARVLDPELLAEMVAEKVREIETAILAQYPDRPIQFAEEGPQTSGGFTDYSLRAGETYADTVIEDIRAATYVIEELENEVLELLDDDAEEDEELYDDDSMLVRDACLAHGVGNEDAINAALDTRDLQIAGRKALMESDKVIPEAATICVIRADNDGGLKPEWYYPDRKAAGLTSMGLSSPAKPKPAAKPGEEGFDPDNPPLTQKATDHVKAMRANMAIRWTKDEKGAETRQRAHKALIFAMAWQQLHPYSSQETGLVHGFAGATYGYVGTDLAPEPGPMVPGLDNISLRGGFALFEEEGTAEDLDALAAWLFARKIAPEVPAEGSKWTLVDDVMAVLHIGLYARRSVNPDLTPSFFGLFTKKVLSAIVGSFHKNYVAGATSRKAAALPGDMAEFIHATDKGRRNWGMGGNTPEKALEWLPAPLRWKKPSDETFRELFALAYPAKPDAAEEPRASDEDEAQAEAA